MSEMLVMDRSGHTKHIWNSDKKAEVTAARELFESLTKKGYLAYHVKKGGDEGEKMKEFDPDAEKMILSPQLKGG